VTFISVWVKELAEQGSAARQDLAILTSLLIVFLSVVLLWPQN